MISTASACDVLRLAVSDTGPLNDLVLIGQETLLPRIIERVTIPEAVRSELQHPATPDVVRAWIDAPPAWLTVEATPEREHGDPALDRLDEGERAAIVLAGAVAADLILMDDRDGVRVGRARGFAVTGTLGLLALAGRRDLIDLPDAITRLRATSFRCRPALLDALLRHHRRGSDTEN